VEIYRAYYEKEEDGNYYDYIEKKTVPKYNYYRKEEPINSFEMITDKEGRAEKSFTVPNRDSEDYYVKVHCTDGNGRRMTADAYIGQDYADLYRIIHTNDYYLDGAKEGYDIGGDVTLTLKRGTNTVTKGNFLFVAMQSGIQSYQAGKNPYVLKFSKEHIPNITVNAYYFNGFTYQSSYYMSKTLSFDHDKTDLLLTAVTDKNSYKPGDMCTITVTAKDKTGKPKVASVNISLVDEALFALKDYTVATRESLYRNLSPGLRLALATHRTFVASIDAVAAIPDGEYAFAMGQARDDEANIREIFKDTAFFSTVKTNTQGQAIYKLRLPDNITSWRLTISGISTDLYAGNSIQNIIVSNPLFINYTLNDEFLLGDKPAIGVNVYGASLSGGEKVNFEVWDESAPDVKYIASGLAFERINIPLWEMKKEGAGALIIKASVSNGGGDAVKHQYQVLKSHREIDTAVYYDVTATTKFAVGSGGLTNIIFTDRGRGAFLPQLLNLRNVYGDRIEKLLARREANRVLAEYFPDLTLYNGQDSFNPLHYQRSDGGIAILPHADSDLANTVKLLPYIKDEINILALKNYLYDIYEGEKPGNKMCALYGLALLKEPVLLDLHNYTAIEKLTAQDAVYIALAYCSLGETPSASALYDSRIAPHLEHLAPYYRVNTGVDNDDILAATSAANMLAAKLGKPEREGLYQYCLKNQTTDILINVEKLSHIEHEIAGKTTESCTITYTLFGEKFTRELKNGASYALRIPVQSLAEFKLQEVTGSAGAVSIYQKPLTELGKADNDIKIRRRYYPANDNKNSSDTFNQGDLVRVQLWIDYSAKAIDGSYCITDYLSAGLEYVSNSAKISGAANWGYGYFCYCTVEGQKVMFYDYNRNFAGGCLYYYYARVISPGAFKAEGPLVQNLIAKDYYTVGGDSMVIIK